MLALEITTALGTSILAFIMGLMIGIALGYILWTDGRDET